MKSHGRFAGTICVAQIHLEAEIQNAPRDTPQQATKTSVCGSSAFYRLVCFPGMQREQKISSEMQWVIVRLSRMLNKEDIATFLDLSTHFVQRVISHFQAHGTIPDEDETLPSLYPGGPRPPGMQMRTGVFAGAYGYYPEPI